MDDIQVIIDNLSNHVIFVLLGDKLKTFLAKRFFTKTPLWNLYTFILGYKDVICNIWDSGESISMIPKKDVDSAILVYDMADKTTTLKTRADLEYSIKIAEKEYNVTKPIILINTPREQLDLSTVLKLCKDLNLKHYILKERENPSDLIKDIAIEIYKIRVEKFNESVKRLLICRQSQTPVC